MPGSLSKDEQAKLEKLGYAVDMLESDDQKIQAYNFKTPKRFTKDNMRLLNTIYDCFAKTLANKLTGVLRTAVQVDVLSINEMVYSQFSQEKRENFILPIIETKLKENDSYSTDHFVMAFSNKTIYTIINKLLGGSDDELENNRKFTVLELNLIKNFIIANVNPILESAWSNYIDFITNTEEIALIPEVNKYFVSDTQTLCIEFEIIIGDLAQKFSICMPIELVENIFRNLGNRFMGLEDSEKINQRKSLMLEHVKESEVEIDVVLGKTELEFADILSLHADDVMMLDSFTDSSVKVIIKGKEWFLGKVGVYRGRKSVKLTETL